jgi:hypothetical protein
VRFIHVVRNPYAVYSSTLNLWRVLFAAHGLQRPTWEGLDESILGTFARLYQSFEEGCRLLPPGRLYELRYEDLVQEPVARIEAAYRELELGDFGPARRPLEEYLAGVSGHEAGTHTLTAAERKAINDRWGFFFRRYGYPLEPA